MPDRFSNKNSNNQKLKGYKHFEVMPLLKFLPGVTWARCPSPEYGPIHHRSTNNCMTKSYFMVF